MTPKSLLEESFPVREVGAASSREKNLRHGHLSTLHIWWARRPLASSRATIYAALTPAPNDDREYEDYRDFIIELSKWENINNPAILEKARSDILNAHGDVPPKVLDPFGGGGSIPLEALRLGCETYSNDYNPVAVLIQKCSVEYPQKFGSGTIEDAAWGELADKRAANPLIRDIVRWGSVIFKDATRILSKYYPPLEDGSIPIGYFWARTLPCQNPICGAEIPLMRQYWLSKKEKKKVALHLQVKDNRIEFSVIGDGYKPFPIDFQPENGTVSRGIVSCPCCGSTIDAKSTKRLHDNGLNGERLVAIAAYSPQKNAIIYIPARKDDIGIFSDIHESLSIMREKFSEQWGFDPLPDEPLPDPGTLGISQYWTSPKTWADLFNTRQQLSYIIFEDLIKHTYQSILEEGTDPNYAQAIVTYLAFVFDKILDWNTRMSTWIYNTEAVGHTFTRQSLPVIWDYFELNPINTRLSGWEYMIERLTPVIENLSKASNHAAIITQCSATQLPYPDNFFDAAFTDPPYYDNVPYAYLSDFFYVWLKRNIGELYPDLFVTPLTPKREEIVAYANRPGGYEGAKQFFEDMLKSSFQEINRVLKPNGIVVIVYAHKSTEGWETLINSLLDSGLVITGSWPINTEMTARMRAMESAALASSIYIVARKMNRQPTGFYSNVKEELRIHLNKKLERLWQEGISGADFFIAAIGSAIEVFGKYEQVMDYAGNIVRADRLLDAVREIATDYVIRQILHNGFAGEISDITRFYILWRWYYGEGKVTFDEARKLGQSCGIDVAEEFSHSGFIRKEKEFIRLLGPQDRKIESLDNATDLIDVLHRILLLWEKSRRDEMIKTLQITGFGKSEAFYRVAQAISETLPIESKEKKLLDGFLAGRERLKDEMRREARQTRLNL